MESMEKAKSRIPLKRWLPTVLFSLAGMAGGFLFYRYVGAVLPEKKEGK